MFLLLRIMVKQVKSSIKQVDISEPTDIKQLISMNQFYPIKTLIFIRDFSYFPIIHHNSIFSTHVKIAFIQISEKADICAVAS